jgi:hypothetical protein
MRQKYHGWAGALIAIGNLALPNSALALGTANPMSSRPMLGTCTVIITIDPIAGAASVIVDSIPFSYAGGSTYIHGLPSPPATPLTSAIVEQCIGVATGSVTGFTANGADSTFSLDEYIGFSFVSENVAYEYALSGVTDTRIIVTVIPLAVAPDEAPIRQVIVDAAARSLQSTISANQQMTRDARERLIAGQRTENADNTQSDVPFDVNATLDGNGATISSQGTFYGAQRVGDGIQQLVFGDFDLQHDAATGSSTATLTGRVAWEHRLSDRTLVGYFVGGELAHSNIAGAFDGNQHRVGATIGGYTVHELVNNIYVDGFVTLGAGQNNLAMANAEIAVDSNYTTRSLAFGGSLSGVIEQPGYEIRPALSFSYGRTWIGELGFAGTVNGVLDNTLSLDAGSVTLVNVMFRPEFVFRWMACPELKARICSPLRRVLSASRSKHPWSWTAAVAVPRLG